MTAIAHADPPGKILALAKQAALSLAGWPPALAKATTDRFDYYTFLRGVGPLRFEWAEPAGCGWVRLHGIEPEGTTFRRLKHPCVRGLEVRLSDLVFVADAPQEG